MARSVPIREFREQLADLLEEVEKRHEHVVVTRRGRPAAVVLSAEEFEEIQETLEILADPELMAKIERAERDFKKGRYRDLIAVRRELGY